MIIWINGAFGSGKTQTAFQLHRRLANSYVFDPEHAGFYIRRNIPKEASKDDFQDYSMWREINYSMLKFLTREYDGTIIVPMTLVNPHYFGEIVGRLRNEGVPVHHFTLCASKEVLHRRLLTRGEGKNSWAAQQMDRCIEGLSSEVFRHHLQTDHMTVESIVETIASVLHLKLQPDHRGRLGKIKDRIITQLKHVRFFD